MDKESLEVYATALMESVWPSHPLNSLLGVDLNAAHTRYGTVVEQAQKLMGVEAFHLPESPMLSPFDDLPVSKGKGYKEPVDLTVTIEPLPDDLDKLEASAPAFLFPSEEKGDATRLIANMKANLLQQQQVLASAKDADALLSLIEYYGSTLPVQEDSSESLFDRAKLTAALAVCLEKNQRFSDELEQAWQRLTAQGSTPTPLDHPTKDLYVLFVKADLSGIQHYIFDVASKGAAKSLKGRSFRVEAYAYMMVDYFLDKLALSPANLMYNGGGNFYMLIPLASYGAFEEGRKEVVQRLFQRTQEHDLDIPESMQVYLGATLVGAKELGENFGPAWSEVDKQVQAQRLSPLQNSLEGETTSSSVSNQTTSSFFDDVFAPLPPVNQTARRELEKAFFKGQIKRRTYHAVGEDYGNQHKPKTYTGFNWYQGFELKPTRSEWRALVKVNHEQVQRIPDPLSAFQRSLDFKEHIGPTEHLFNRPFLFRQGEHQKQFHPFSYLVKDLPLWTDDLLRTYEKALDDYKEGLSSLLDEEDLEKGKAKPPDVGHLLQFGHLGMLARLRTGTDKIGVLKLDVDNLGALFHGPAPLAQKAALSRAMSWFFGGYMNVLLDTNLHQWLSQRYGPPTSGEEGFLHAYLEKVNPDERFRDNLYVIFSGGDDCIMVGAWDVVVEFAIMVHEAFDRFTAGRATLSAGLHIIDPKYPVSQFSIQAEAALKKAKTGDKNQVAIFDEVVTWTEYRLAMNLRNTLYYLVTKSEKPESKAIIHKVRKSMYGFEKLQQQVIERRRVSLPRFWRLQYFLRDVKKENLDLVQTHVVQVYEGLIMKTLRRKQTHNPVLIAIGARWAEFMTRKSDTE